MTISMNDYSIEAFMDYLTIEKGCSPNTIKGYSHDLYGLIEFLNRNSDYATPINWSSITLIQLRGYLANLYNDRKNKNSSIHRRVCSIKAFFKFLISNKMIIADPSEELQYPKRPQSLPKFVPKDSIQILINNANNPLHKVIIEVLYSTGVRCNELRNMNIDDVNFNDSSIRINSGKGGKDRIVLLSKRAAPRLMEYVDGYRQKMIKKAEQRKKLPLDSYDALFISNRGLRISNRTIQDFISKISENSGLKNTTPHVLRHSFASHLVMDKTNIRVVQQLLGHASLETTQIYANVSTDYIKSEFQDKLNF